eukprot:4667519-Pyramimonas_sp.AAC.1
MNNRRAANLKVASKLNDNHANSGRTSRFLPKDSKRDLREQPWPPQALEISRYTKDLQQASAPARGPQP